MRNLFLVPFGVVVLLAVIFCPTFNAFAAKPGAPVVNAGDSSCARVGRFPTGTDVYASGANFTPSSTVDIYVTLNKNWHSNRQPIGSDVGDGVNANVPTDSAGNLSCTKIWVSASTGAYDVVVDNNQDGTFDPADGDAIDGQHGGAGFRVF